MSIGNKIKELIRQGHSYTYISNTLGCAKSTISYHVRRNNMRPLDTNGQARYDWIVIKQYYDADDTVTFRDLTKQFGVGASSITKAVKRGDIIPRSKELPLAEIMTKDASYQTTRLKGRLLNDGILTNRCYNTKCTLHYATDMKWAGEPIVLHLDHINGIPNDHRLTNLRLLCPNCHSQTPTYAGKNIKRNSSE